MQNWKKNLIAGAILVTVCGGIYLNWLYMEDLATGNFSDTLNSDKLLSDDLTVMGTEGEVDAAVSTGTDYFAAVRLSRQQARDSAVTTLQEAMAYSDKDSQAGSQLDAIVQTALQEAQIESMVIAKGYADCVAYIGEDGISVAVASPEGGLQNADVALIADIVMSASNFSLPDIRVVVVQWFAGLLFAARLFFSLRKVLYFPTDVI